MNEASPSQAEAIQAAPLPEATEAPPSAAPVEAPAVMAMRAAFDRAALVWVAQDIANSPVSRSTEAWNHLNAALPRLADVLAVVMSAA